MIRRSTLVFLTCLGALGSPAVLASTVTAATETATTETATTEPILIAQAATGEAAAPATTNALSIGARGRAVRELQNQLTAAGYYEGPLDGIYGLGTQRAVLAFQEDQGFEPTGRLDNDTWEALEAYEAQTSEPGPASESTDGASSEAPAAPAADLPPVGEPAAEGEEASASGMSKVFGIGIGLAAVLASFGVGFFMANRGKSEFQDDIEPGEDWSEADLQAGVLNGNGGASFANGNGVASNGFVGNGAVASGAMATIPANGLGAQARGGQLGGTAPMGKADIFDGLIKDLHNPDPQQRRKVIWELGQRGNSLAVQPLVDAMVDADSKEKSLVLAALSEIGIRSLRPMNRALAIALQDDNPEVRKNAIRDLTRIYELVVQISQMLGHAQEDEEPEVRQTASWALEQLNRIRRSQDVDSNMRSLPTNSGPKSNRFAL